ncbi:MAG: DUF932 domain-containing protein [Deltaproteobacteria bacterium]|nr:DUF932 domain-containing protein [Deltaproteobacteria bacterium]
MPFLCEPIVEMRFKSLKDVDGWLSGNEDRLERVSIGDWIERGARFFDDEYFGDEGRFLRFNQNGIRVLLQKLGLRFDTLQRVERPGLISELLNDLMSQQDIIERFEDHDFVVNARSDTVLGAVSKSYVFYSNQDFIQDIQDLLSGGQIAFFPKDSLGRFRYVNGFSVNTQLFLRFILRVESGRVTGPGGEGEDVTEIGIQFKNSMVGDAAVSIQYFVHRLLCANGLIVPVGKSHARVFHSGKRQNFVKRLDRSFREVERKIGSTATAVKSLMSMDFDPESLVRTKLTPKVFDIIPGSRSRIMAEHRIPKRQKTRMTRGERTEYEASIIDHIPKTFVGKYASRVFNSPHRENATMFDFINIFTEYAQTQSIHRQLDMEERAGVLADQIVKNKRKFVSGKDVNG